MTEFMYPWHMTLDKNMTLDEFNSTVSRNERPEYTELDMRPFGPQQPDAVDFWLNTALKQGDLFRKIVVLKTDASMVLSPTAGKRLAKLLEPGQFTIRNG